VGVLLARLVEAFANDFVGRRRVKGRWKNTDITRLTGKVELRLLWAKKALKKKREEKRECAAVSKRLQNSAKEDKPYTQRLCHVPTFPTAAS
jgi:hypothetical protein